MDSEHPFATWAGTWVGEGRGEYPTIEPFTYTEELEIIPVPGRPLAHWRTRTRDGANGEPKHAESGFLRAGPDGVELVLAHGFGVVEVATGTVGEAVLELRADNLGRTPTAKQVDRVERRYELDGDSIAYTMSMAAVGVPLTHHLRGELRRAG